MASVLPAMEAKFLSANSRLRAFHYAAALAPAVALLVVAVFVNRHSYDQNRILRIVDQAQLAAANVDLKLRQLLDLTSYCVTSPSLLDRVDLVSFEESCGRFATRIDAWVVIVETGETHRQILNTLIDAPDELPVYPRENERAPLLALEARSRSSGMPGVADVFTGYVRPEAIVTAGQHLRLGDGREAMLYVAISARSLSDQLAELSSPQRAHIWLVDPSQRVVARSTEIDRVVFAPVPRSLRDGLETGTAGAALGMAGLEGVEALWDVGYQPLEAVSGWTVVAVEPSELGLRLWAPLSLPSAITFAGLLLSGLLIWGIANHDQAARQIEAAREAEVEAKRHDQEKSRILASLAHDIRSPLISLIGSLETIGRGPSEPTSNMTTARSAAEALLQLVDDILELSFLGSPEMSLHSSFVDLRQLATALINQNLALADRKGLSLQINIDPELPPVVELDRRRIQRVLSNLITNALKYTEQGSVTLRIRVEGMAPGGVTLDLAVIDTGLGLNSEEIPHILREFGRLEREAERREAGSGLGLAIVQRILSAMGTSLIIESTPGQGSNFHFRLKLPVPSNLALTNSDQQLSGIEILYAEDEPVIRQVTIRRLEDAGARVLGAVDGEDAQQQLAKVSPDLLLIDLQMPGLDGAQLIRRLGEVAPDRDYPIFVLTSYISGSLAEEARAAGADAVFTKPVQVAALAAALRARLCSAEPSQLATSPVSEEVPLLDMQTFRDATGTRGHAYAIELVRRFKDSIHEDRAEFAAKVSAGEMQKASRLAHRCMGLCQVLGANTLAHRLLLLEQKAAAGLLADVMELASECDELADATLQQMYEALETELTYRP